ncbi:MAG: FAD:protein FMN transferase [Flavobacteriaceae bacterium]|nr:FAD:protein FMN transferase [Flavobacteriaceae bacterium]
MIKQILILFITFTIVSCGENSQKEIVHIEGVAFGSSFSVKYLDNTSKKYDKSIDSMIHAINKSLSTYLPTSDISRINKGDSTVVVDALFEEVFTKSKKIHQETNGIFDPTIGILVNAWGFGPEKPIENLDSIKVKSLLQFVGFEKVVLKDHFVKKASPQIYLDFNSIAPGFAADVIGRFLESKNIHDYMIEIGGEIRARGKNQKGNDWKIAIENPNFDGSRSFAAFISLKNQSLATSGNYRKFKIDENGQKYAHTINTKTGFSSKTDLLSCTVISNSDCADVDGYATAFMAMGYQNTLEFLKNRPDLKVFLIYSKPDGTIATYATVKFEK